MSRSGIDEVLEFAKSVAEARALASQATSLAQACEETQIRLVALRIEEAKARADVSAAHESAKATVSDAAEKADGIMTEAHNRADRDFRERVAAAVSKVGEIQHQVEDLIEQRDTLAVEVKDLYGQRDVLEGRVMDLENRLDKIRASLAE